MQRVFFTSWYSDNSAVYFYDISIFKNPQKKKYFWFRIQNDRKKKKSNTIFSKILRDVFHSLRQKKKSQCRENKLNSWRLVLICLF